MKRSFFYLIIATILTFSNVTFATNYRGVSCPNIDANGNCNIGSGDSYMENNAYAFATQDGFLGVINSEYQNYSSSADVSNYYGDGTLEFAVQYNSTYDRDAILDVTYYALSQSPFIFDVSTLPIGTQFNHNIGIDANNRLNELKFTSYNIGSFRINGNIYVNSLTNDAETNPKLSGDYNDFTAVTYIYDPNFNSLFWGTSDIASDVFDVVNVIDFEQSEDVFSGYGGLNFLFDNSNSGNKIINAAFGVDNTDRFEVLSIENNRTIAEGDVTINFNRDIYAMDLKLRTELQPGDTQISQLASNININFQDLTANINNVNIGTIPTTNEFDNTLRVFNNGNWDYRSENPDFTAPYSQIAGSLYLNNANITSQTFNIGDHGELYLSVSGQSSVTSRDIAFGDNSKIIIRNHDLNGVNFDYTFLTATNDIATTDALNFQTATGEYISINDITRDSLIDDIIELEQNSSFFYDISITAHDNNGAVINAGESTAVRSLRVSSSVKDVISTNSNNNNILHSILASDNAQLSNIKTALRSKNSLAAIEDLTERATSSRDNDNFTSSGVIVNKSNDVVSNRIFNSMIAGNVVNDSISDFNQNYTTQNIINNIYQRRYSDVANVRRNDNLNFAQLMSHDVASLSFNNVGVWVQPFGSIYDYSGMDAFDANIYGILAGVDKKFSNMFNKNYRSLFGASYGYFISDIDSANGSNLEITSNQLSFYNANYHKSGLGLYNKNILSLTFNNNDFNRSVNDNGINILDANANYDSDQYHLSSSIGYVAELYDMVNANKFLRNLFVEDVNIKKKGELALFKRMLINTNFAIGYNHFTSYSYDESGSGILQSVNNKSYDNITTTLSVKLSGKHKGKKRDMIRGKPTIYILGKYATEYLKEDEKYSFKPSIKFSWLKNHDIGDRQHQIRFNNLDNSNIITANSGNLISNIYSTDLGLEILNISDGSIIDLSYKFETGSNLTGHSTYIKYAKRF